MSGIAGVEGGGETRTAGHWPGASLGCWISNQSCPESLVITRWSGRRARGARDGPMARRNDDGNCWPTDMAPRRSPEITEYRHSDSTTRMPQRRVRHNYSLPIESAHNIAALRSAGARSPGIFHFHCKRREEGSPHGSWGVQRSSWAGSICILRSHISTVARLVPSSISSSRGLSIG